MSKIKLALLKGGISGEREVSLNTAKQIYKALNKNKYEIFQYDTKTDLNTFFNAAIEKKFDVVFPALHGPYGEDGKLQGMMDMIKIPYVFSGCLASALAMNKDKTKTIAQAVAIKTIPSLTIKKNETYDIQKIISSLTLPIVVKPVELGSSVGMSLCKTEEELKKGIETGFNHDPELLLEKYIKGRELTVAIIEQDEIPKPLPVIEIKPRLSEWFDYKAKYEPGASEEICPAQIPDNINGAIEKAGTIIFKALGCKDLARADFIWETENNILYFLEINTIPGMTATSLAPQAAKASGLDFSEFLDILINNNL